MKDKKIDFNYLMFFNVVKQRFYLLPIPQNKHHQAVGRLIRKVYNSANKFQWWLSLTIAEKKIKTQVDYLEFTPMYNMDDFTVMGMTSYLRSFLNSLRTYVKKYTEFSTMSYFWIYEQGEKSNRPHFHMGLSDVGIESTGFNSYELPIRKFIYKRWKSGNVHARYIQNRDMLFDYLDSYITKEKTHKFDKFIGKRFWSTSQDIRPIPKNPDFEYIGTSPNSNLLVSYAENIIKWSPVFGCYIQFDELKELAKERGLIGQEKISDYLSEPVERKFPYNIYTDVYYFKEGFSNMSFSHKLPILKDYSFQYF